MAIYCIDDGGDGSQINTTQSASTLDWSKADASVADLISYDAAAFTTAGNIIYFGDDHNDPNKAANWTLTGPTSGVPVILISADRTQATPTYKAGTGNQLSSLGGNYTLILDGSFACYGIRAAGGGVISSAPDTDETMLLQGCTFAVAQNSYLNPATNNGGNVRLLNCVVDLSADASSARSQNVISGFGASSLDIHGLTFVTAQYRTGSVIQSGNAAAGQQSYISNADFSGFTNATACEICAPGSLGMNLVFANCLTAATWTAFASGSPGPMSTLQFNNCGPADAPTSLILKTYYGDLVSAASIYRTGGATVEGDACSWLITTTANCAEGAPFYTPWIYGEINTPGSRYLDLYITNDTADFTDAEVWLEVEYLSAADEAIWSLITDQRSTITATAAAQEDDTTSTWTGTGPSFTYKQRLRVNPTVAEAGQYRARVAVGVASIASSRYFYVDPDVTVS